MASLRILLLLLLPFLGYSQGKIYFGGTSGTDTATTLNYLFVPKLAKLSSGQFITTDSRGKFILATPSGSGGGADSADFYTVYRSDTSRVNIYGQIELRFKTTDTAGEWLNAGWLPYLVKYSDTASMLANYLREVDTSGKWIGLGWLPALVKYTDTAALVAPYLKESDTAGMLLAYLRKSDTAGMLSPYLKESDTSGMLLPYMRKTDTAQMLAPYLKESDTAGMLAPYLKESDTAGMLTPYVRHLELADTASAIRSDLAISPYPEPSTFGTIYSKSSWGDLADFSTAGNAAVSLSGGYPQLTSSTLAFSNYVKILPNRLTLLDRHKMVSRVKVNTIPGSITAISQGVFSTNPANTNDVVGVLYTSGGVAGVMEVYTASGDALLASGASIAAPSANDVIEITTELTDSTVIFKCQNITTGGAVSTLTYTYTIAGVSRPNTCNWGFGIFSQTTPASYEVQSVNITSNAVKYPNVLFMGNSKTQGYYATYWNTRFGAIVGNLYPPYVIYGDGSGTTVDAMTRIQEIGQTNPRQVIFSDLVSNDVRFGVADATTKANYQYLTEFFTNGGTPVYHFVIPEDSTAGGVGLTAINDWIKNTYPTTYLAVWDSLSTGNILDGAYDYGDGVHLNQAANTYIAQIITNAGIIDPIGANNPIISKHGPSILQTGDSLDLSFGISRGSYYLPRWDATTNNLVPSRIWDDGTYTKFSRNPNIMPTTAGVDWYFDGAVEISGINGSLTVKDRSAPSTEQYNFHANGIFFYSFNGSPYAYTGNNGNWRFGSAVGTPTILSTIQIDKDQATTDGNYPVALSVDTASYTVTGTFTDNGSVVRFSPGLFSNASSNYSNLSTVEISGTPYITGGMTAADLWALRAVGRVSAESYFIGADEVLSVSGTDVLVGRDATFGKTRIYGGSTSTVEVTANVASVSGSLQVSSTTVASRPVPVMTAAQGSALTPGEGDLIYVTDTDATFTSKGWWGYNGAAWERLNN